jgi:phosphoribosylamine---glycine ligase
MNILIIGGGGREHALAWKVKQSPLCSQLFIAPGNPGTMALGQNIAVSLSDFDQIALIIQTHHIELVIIGPEDPLVHGLTDFLEAKFNNRLKIIGPGKSGAQLEGSKAFAKSFMADMNIPTAAYASFQVQDHEAAKAYIRQMKTPIVIKADGLAAGKGVTIAATIAEALAEVESMFTGKFGQASTRIVVEEFLAGREFSMFVLTDGNHYKILPLAKDYKKVLEGDLGPNTGGMGAISPVPFVSSELMHRTIERVVKPSILGIQQKNLNYKGILFIGLIEVEGNPYVIEYNCRLGDPETEVVLPKLASDLVAHFDALAEGRLEHEIILEDDRSVATVMLVSGGYPGEYQKNKPIHLPDSHEESILFHAGTKRNESGILLTAGGRVMAVTSYGISLKAAVKNSYRTIDHIHFEEMQYRKDIGTF